MSTMTSEGLLGVMLRAQEMKQTVGARKGAERGVHKQVQGNRLLRREILPVDALTLGGFIRGTPRPFPVTIQMFELWTLALSYWMVTGESWTESA